MEGDSDSPPPPSYLVAASLSNSPLIPHSRSSPTQQPLQPQQQKPLFEHSWSQLNLPSGLFLLKNRSQGKTLDLLGHKSHEGAPFGVHPVKQPSLKGLSLQHLGNNQLFFLDWNGHLYSASASRAVDVVDDQLSLAHPHPIQLYPSPFSHPLPRFYLDPSTQTLEILFNHDPTFPPPLHPTASSESSYEEYDYLVETVPMKGKRRPGIKRNVGSTGSDVAKKAGEVVFNGIEGLLGRVNGFNPFAASSAASTSAPTEGGGGGKERTASISTTMMDLEKKRLPRNRDASLPPPPIPSKGDSPPSPPSPTNRHYDPSPLRKSDADSSLFTSSPTTSMKTQQEHFEARRNSELPAISPTSPLPAFSRQSPATSPLSSPRLAQNQTQSPSVEETQKGPSQEEEDSSSGESDSDDEPSAFRPVRIIKLLKTSNWREREFPFNNSSHSRVVDSNSKTNKVTPPNEDIMGEETGNRPIGLGFEDTRTAPSQAHYREQKEDDLEGLTAENVWPETLSVGQEHGRETSFASTTSTYLADNASISPSSNIAPPPPLTAAEQRRKRRQELKEIRKWRRRQWEVVPVQVEPQPALSSGASFRVRHDLEEDMYCFQGELSDGEIEGEENVRAGRRRNGYELDEEEVLSDEEERGRSSISAPSRVMEAAMREKRGSIETAKSVVSGVGSFFTSKLLWSVSTSSTPQQPNKEGEDETDLPPLPVNDDSEDAEELRSDELEKIGNRNRVASSTRRKSSLANVVASPPLPDLPRAPTSAIEVPLPESLPNSPQVGGDKEKERVLV